MSEKYSTDELVNIFNNHSVDHPYYFGFDVVNAIIARLRAVNNLENKSLMKLAADLGVSFSVAKILEDHVRAEYDVRLRAADALCEAAIAAKGFIEIYGGTTERLSKAIAEYERKA